MQLSRKLRGGEGVIVHWCAGCEEAHVFHVTPRRGPVWRWNGDAERPSFEPSMLIWPHEHEADRVRLGRNRCHYIVTEGMVLFLPDTTHRLSGQTIPLPDLPAHLQDGED